MNKVICTFAIAAMSIAGGAQALEFELDTEFSGAAPASGAPVATFVDMGNYVELTMDLKNLSGGEFVSQWYFNFTGDLSKLVISHFSGQVADNGGFGNGVFTGSNAYKADGDGFYDILFDFPPPTGGEKFTAGEKSVFNFSYDDDSDISDLDFLGIDFGGTKGDFYSAAHVQGITDVGFGTSGWMGTPVPEPGTYLMLGSTLLFAAAARTRKTKKA